MNSDEQKLKQLFSELRDDDAWRAPSFAHTLGAAREKQDATRGRTPLVFFARPSLALAALIAIFVIGAHVFHSETAMKTETSRAAKSDATTSDNVPWQTGVLVSQIQSPTDFLLASRGTWQPAPLLDFSTKTKNQQ